MPRKPNYSYERRQREIAKAAKKAARLEARARKPERQADESPPAESDGQAAESPPGESDGQAAESPPGESDGQADESPPKAEEVR